MIAILHGYLLEGSGSNLWTRAILRALCRQGRTVHLVCQEHHPESHDFIAAAYVYDETGAPTELWQREVPYPGRCVMHRPGIGELLPVYVWDAYDDFARVVPMVDLDDDALETYLQRNVAALRRIVRDHDITAMHANHCVLMSVVATRVGRDASIPFAIMPHGSAIEYAVKKDPRMLRHATDAFAAAQRIFVIGPELRERVRNVLGASDLDEKMLPLHLGVDTDLFAPIPRDARATSIDALGAALRNVPRASSMRPSLTTSFSPNTSITELKTLLDAAPHGNSKSPDADIETQLAKVDWANDPLILFVGRLIASKGPQSLLAAVPSILAAHPQARFIFVGHGPLRGGLEAMAWALENDARAMLDTIAEDGRVLEGGLGPFEEVRSYLAGLSRFPGELDAYFAAAASVRDHVIFTGYFTHDLLHTLFGCADVAVFPSVVAEAGPLVFLEALASGCLPLGTYFAGMGASVDAVIEALPGEELDYMKLNREPADTVRDIVAGVDAALARKSPSSADLRQIAVDHFDWQSVAKTLADDLEGLAHDNG